MLFCKLLLCGNENYILLHEMSTESNVRVILNDSQRKILPAKQRESTRNKQRCYNSNICRLRKQHESSSCPSLRARNKTCSAGCWWRASEENSHCLVHLPDRKWLLFTLSLGVENSPEMHENKRNLFLSFMKYIKPTKETLPEMCQAVDWAAEKRIRRLKIAEAPWCI